MKQENYTISASCKLSSSQEKENNETVKETLKRLYKKHNISYPKFFKMDPLSKVGFLATEILLKAKKLTDTYACEDIAIIFENKSSSIDADINHHKSIQDNNHYFPSPAIFVYTLPNIVEGEICLRHGFKGENFFSIALDKKNSQLYNISSSVLALEKAKCIIVGWVESKDEYFDVTVVLVEPNHNTTHENISFNAKNLQKIINN